jgi:hypothetical protein
MNRIISCAVIFFVTGAASQVQSAEDGISGLETCFRAARLSDVVCSDASNPPEQRLDCFQKARAAQLECLEHVPLGVTGTATSSTPPEVASSPKPASQQLEIEPAPVQKPDKVAEPQVATAPPETSPVVVAPAAPTPVVPPVLSVPPTLSVPPSVSGKAADVQVKPSSSSWIVSETTSPIDYSPLIIATMRAASGGKDAPTVLSIMCRRLRTEIMVRTDGTWRIPKNNKIQVAFQINDKSTNSVWNLSADGKTATNSDNAVELLQSLPEGVPLKVSVSDGVDHGATFQLAGVDLVRRKIAAACKLAPVPDSKLSLGKR